MRITEALATILMHRLKSDRCPVCRKEKRTGQALCTGCYFAIPEDMRVRLWLCPLDHGQEFFEAYELAIQAAHRILRPSHKPIFRGKELEGAA